MGTKNVLIIDQDPQAGGALAEVLEKGHYEVSLAENEKKGLIRLKASSFDAVILDASMLPVMPKLREQNSSLVLLVVADQGSCDQAVQAMKLGAHEYLTKPYTPEEIRKILDATNATTNIDPIPKKNSPSAQKRIIAESAPMQQIMQNVERIAATKASVLITGESGTGKEVIAQAIYQQSNRAHHPFIKVNCAAVPETLIESEFFGHEKGAFTGASQKRKGRFERANNGTLLLDEITEIPPSMQAKLLRVLQEEEFERVGGNQPVTVDVRIVSTSNRNIQQAINEKVLRADLFYRLNVIPIYIPPLRERIDDVLPLANYFLDLLSTEDNHKQKQLTEEAQQALLSFSWPGNVRQLANIIERAYVLTDDLHIHPKNLHLNYHNTHHQHRTIAGGFSPSSLNAIINRTLANYR